MSDKGFEFPLGAGAMAVLKPKMRTTLLAGFREEYPDAVKAVVDGPFSTCGGFRLDESAVKFFLGGLSSSATSGIITFLVDCITDIVIPEGASVSDEWAILDWRGMDKDQREEVVDLMFSTLDLVCMFIAAWGHYQGLSSGVRR